MGSADAQKWRNRPLEGEKRVLGGEKGACSEWETPSRKIGGAWESKQDPMERRQSMTETEERSIFGCTFLGEST